MLKDKQGNSSSTTLKNDLRSTVRMRLAAMDETLQKQKSLQIQAVLNSYLQAHKERLWGAYLPMKGEADPCTEKLPFIKWCYPRRSKSNLKFYFIQSTEELQTTSYGLREPSAHKEAMPEGLLIPGLAFNRQGYRLGRGKAYYDNYLQNFSGLKVGICFSEQIIEQKLNLDPWDQKMDLLIHDQGLITCEEK